MLRAGTLQDMAEIRRLNEQSVRQGTKGFYTDATIQQWTGPFRDWYYPKVFTEHQAHALTHVDTHEASLRGAGRAIDNEIYFLFVDPKYIGQGIGSNLLLSLEKEIAKTHRTVTVLSTLNAVPFYTKHGYQPVKTGGYDIGNGLWLECLEMSKELI